MGLCLLFRRRRWHVAAALWAVLLPAPIFAQLLPTRAATANADTTVSVGSPRMALQNYLRLAEAKDWEGAAEYLAVPRAEKDRADQLARRLKIVLDQRLALNVATVSASAVGDTTDGDADGDRIGVIVGPSGREEPVRMVRVSGSGPTRWVFSAGTVEDIDHWFESLSSPWLREKLSPSLMREGPLHVYYWQWIGLLLAIPVLYLCAWVVTTIVHAVLQRGVARTANDWDDALLEHLGMPFRFWVGALAAGGLGGLLDLNARMARLVSNVSHGLVLLSFFWALLRVIRIFQQRIEKSAWESQDSARARTLVPLLGNLLRVTVLIIAVLVALAQFGYPVGTLLAGLGIGGIAVALAAQKTVEHLFGSVSLAADRAFRVGDWVRAGTTEGEVERIGLRSTSFRTHDRTVVRVPNGRLADERIETFGERDRMLLRTTIGVTYETTPDMLDKIRDDLEAAIRAHPLNWPDIVRVNVVSFGDSSIDIDVLAWFTAPSWNEFLRIRHHLLLEFMRIVEGNGSSFAFPSRTIYHASDAATRPGGTPDATPRVVD